MVVYTFQTVKLSLETWGLVAKLMNAESLSMSEALERLVRHGAIRYAQFNPTLEDGSASRASPDH